MSQRVIRLLHVEDDELQRELVQHHLAVIDEYQFDISCAESAESALEIFDHRGADFVLLDYQLRQGDGLNCLKELRRRDPIVPIIAVSGVATPEITAELLESGADNFLTKLGLTSAVLARSMREALIRINSCRPRILANSPTNGARDFSTDSPNGFVGP